MIGASPKPVRLLLDANVLLLFFIGLLDRDLIPRFKRTRTFTVEDFDLLVEIVSKFPSIATTPHILCEVSNLSGQLTDDHRVTYFTAFAQRLIVLDEHYTPAATLAQEPIFARLGLTDAGIASAARNEDLAVITVDLDLWLHLEHAGIAAHNFNHVRQLGWVP